MWLNVVEKGKRILHKYNVLKIYRGGIAANVYW